MKRIIMHWTTGNYNISASDHKAYHFIIDKHGGVTSGKFKPEDNLKPKKGKYAAHTYKTNTGAIGIACAGMFKAKQTPLDFGEYPLTKVQVNSMCYKIAQLCLQYEIAVSRTTVLSHGEVQDNLGIKQKGKWDIAALPWMKKQTALAIGDYLRRKVKRYIVEIERRNVKRKEVDRAPIKQPVNKATVGITTTLVGLLSGIAYYWKQLIDWIF